MTCITKTSEPNPCHENTTYLCMEPPPVPTVPCWQLGSMTSWGLQHPTISSKPLTHLTLASVDSPLNVQLATSQAQVRWCVQCHGVTIFKHWPLHCPLWLVMLSMVYSQYTCNTVDLGMLNTHTTCLFWTQKMYITVSWACWSTWYP